MSTQNPLLTVGTLGQSLWLDFIRRSLLTSGGLQRYIDEDGVRGITSNPSIFEKAITGSHDYDEAIAQMVRAGRDASEMYETLAVEDVRHAADLFRPLYDRLEGRDGFVSLEVSPRLAHDTAGTIGEGRRLWAAVDRPNVMIKVPATREGLPAIRQLIADGVNVNVTLLFGLDRYRDVLDAWLGGLEARIAAGGSPERVASVASVFLSRIDVLVDPQLDALAAAGGERAGRAGHLRGQTAMASARLAYQIFKEAIASPRFAQVAARGARPQRLLWASTSTKDPAYSDVKYVDALIGPDTVNTLPVETLEAYRDHGHPAARLESDLGDARRTVGTLRELGFDLDAITTRLETEGVAKFEAAFDRLLAALEGRRRAARVDRQTLALGEADLAVRRRLKALGDQRAAERLWRKDGSLWKPDAPTQEAIRKALGWLHVAEKMEDAAGSLLAFRDEVRAAGIRHVVHMGMGGSSLAPLVFQRTLPEGGGGLPLTVLDTTDPATILRIEREVPLGETLFIVASKSGTTAEPNAFGEYFYAKVKALKGEAAGSQFVAITDPGTPLVALATERHFRRTFLNFADIGGRYSALSHFGLVPAALMGADVEGLLDRALRMMHACAGSVPVDRNPGAVLGAVLGELGRDGRDKVTFVMPAAIDALGMWLEQLLAESTGKEGTGLLPVAGEPVGEPEVYGADRLFAYLHVDGRPDAALEARLAALQQAGQPVVRIAMEDRLDLAEEFLRWEIATAIAGAVLGINAFDQPNVQESKDNTNRLLQEVRDTGHLPASTPTVVDGVLRFYASAPAKSAGDLLAGFLGSAKPGDYVAIQAYVTETPATEAALQELRTALRDRLRLATTVGYGPRFLHSTGQFHKGGPNTGLFLQLTADDAEEAPIPGQSYGFGVFKAAQALGDLQALHQHRRRAIRVHLGADVPAGLAALQRLVDEALRVRR
ncbi:MAG: bifunctional transaldolase/phosoglucose isomerase [Acidobacteriota bacterium]|nr:bifunctional transaldolase/phosoglucose isomerase [Acidobacteriota bacterium]